MAKRDLLYVGSTVWDRANPVKALCGFMARPIADMRMAELTAAETAELGKLFAAAPLILEALTALHSLFDFEEEVATGEHITFSDPSALNEAFRNALAAIAAANGTPATMKASQADGQLPDGVSPTTERK